MHKFLTFHPLELPILPANPPKTPLWQRFTPVLPPIYHSQKGRFMRKKMGCGQEGGEERITAARGHQYCLTD